MYRIAVIAALVLLTFTALSAKAEETRVPYPFMAGSLHEGPLDMVYYVDPSEELEIHPNGDFHLYATFVDDLDQEAPFRRHIILADGENAEVVVPGHPDAIYHFWRRAQRVHASVRVVEPEVVAAAGEAPQVIE
ncbi:hypothetical protein KHP62_18820 [Rhodobacteraceae bacterium NNCM2]|nr:hypothetical protein [Coraliihabitans acroporae]